MTTYISINNETIIKTDSIDGYYIDQNVENDDFGTYILTKGVTVRVAEGSKVAMIDLVRRIHQEITTEEPIFIES